MKKITALIANSSLILALSLFSTSTASADSYTAPYISVNFKEIINNAHNYGLAYIYSISYEDNKYYAEGILDNGLMKKIELAAETGKVLTKPIEKQKVLSMIEAIDAVEAKGYSHCYGIKIKDDSDYEINCIDKENRKSVVLVNINNGAVGQEWF